MQYFSYIGLSLHVAARVYDYRLLASVSPFSHFTCVHMSNISCAHRYTFYRTANPLHTHLDGGFH